MRLFLDANILFSASRGAGAIRRLLQRSESAGHTLVADGYVAAEAERNLAAKAGSEAVAVLRALLARIEMQPARAVAHSDLAMDWLDAKDRPVLIAGISARCDLLVTGDKKHFGQAYGARHKGVLVCSPVQCFMVLEQAGTR